MADLTDSASNEDPLAPSNTYRDPPPKRSQATGGSSSRYGEELHSVTIRARQRTFYIDLKRSGQGKFLKLSEKSRNGQKTTIIFDAEDLPKFIDALKEMQEKL